MGDAGGKPGLRGLTDLNSAWDGVLAGGGGNIETAPFLVPCLVHNPVVFA
jgi:hypothetical protein